MAMAHGLQPQKHYYISFRSSFSFKKKGHFKVSKQSATKFLVQNRPNNLCNLILGYANEVGESFRALVSKTVVNSTYVIAFSYVLADATSKSKQPVVS